MKLGQRLNSINNQMIGHRLNNASSVASSLGQRYNNVNYSNLVRNIQTPIQKQVYSILEKNNLRKRLMK
jgi:hypothetical protein